VLWVLFLFGLEVLKYFFFVISSPSLSRNRLFWSPSPSREGSSKSLYKGFIVVNKIDFNKIPTAYFKL
jgi:hypothetical protein